MSLLGAGSSHPNQPVPFNCMAGVFQSLFWAKHKHYQAVIPLFWVTQQHESPTDVTFNFHNTWAETLQAAVLKPVMFPKPLNFWSCIFGSLAFVCNLMP